MGLDKEINDALASAFATTKLDVINESHLHAGHAGDDGTGESHWRVVLPRRNLPKCRGLRATVRSMPPLG